MELTKEEKDLAYKLNSLLESIEADLENARINMENGKFLTAFDLIRDNKTKSQIAAMTLRNFIEILQNKKIW